MTKFTFYLKREEWPLTYTVGYCPGQKSTCPKCLSDKISIFFKPGFLGKNMNYWCELMDENKFELCDDYNIIQKNNYAPNWICKNCYNGGVILKIN
jgi:hypothetical protein